MYSTESKPRGVVGLYSPAWPPDLFANGIVSYVGNLALEFTAQDLPAWVVTPRVVGKSGQYRGIPTAILPPSTAHRWADRIMSIVPFLDRFRMPASFARIGIGLETAASRLSLELIEMEESFGIARYLQRISGIPVVIRLHGPWFLNGAALGVKIDMKYIRKKSAEGRAIAAADGVTAPSQDVLERVRREYNLELPHAVAIPNPAPVIPPERRWAAKDVAGEVVLFVGRFDRHKGGDIVIDAFERIARARPESRLVFVGPDRGLADPYGSTRSLAGYIEERLSPETRRRVEVKGQMSSEDIAGLRRSARVTILPSRYENCSMALLEALSLGCPTVASAAGGNPEILLDGKTGFLCKPCDSSSLAEKTLELLREPRRAEELGRAAASDMAERFSPRRIAELTWSYYESVLDRVSRRGRMPPLGAFMPLIRFLAGGVYRFPTR
jgi:glycosyltransferase involved in cell wall biosynthesis